MSIEKHCTSLEVSKKLAPYFNNPYYWWCIVTNMTDRAILMDERRMFDKGELVEDKYPALLATEILERLPRVLINRGFYNKQFDVIYSAEQVTNKTLPDALAEMFLLLVEKGVIKG